MIRFYTVLFLLSISLSSFGQQSAGQYMNVIGEQFQKISSDMMSYTSAANHGKSARKVEKRRGELIAQVKESEAIVRKMKPFNGSTTLRDSVTAYFKITGILLNQDYAKIVDMEEVAEQSYDAMEAYLLAKEKAEEKLDAAHKSASDQYKAFAAQNNIKFSEGKDELDLKMEKAGRVNEYANKAYLLFFKSYKNEVYLMAALEKRDITALEQSRNALATSAAEDLLKSGELQPFNADGSMKNALQQTLKFFKSETEKIGAYSELLLAEDNFNKIKKSFDATPASKRTKESVDAYNKAVADYNAKINASNALNEDLNKKRAAAYKLWNDTYDKFLDTHTPKYK